MTGAHSTLGPVLDTSTEPVWVVAGAQLVQCLLGIPDSIPILRKSLVLTVVAHGFNPSALEAHAERVPGQSGTQRNPV